MYICLCKGITDKEIEQAVQDGATTPRALRRELGVMTGCGQCSQDVKALAKSCQQTCANKDSCTKRSPFGDMFDMDDALPIFE